MVLPEAAEDGGEAGPLVEVEGREADAVQLVREPLGLVAHGLGVEHVGGDAPEHEVGRREGPLGQALDGLRYKSATEVVVVTMNNSVSYVTLAWPGVIEDE